MSFNIGSQSGGVVNNVAGNQRVEGGQHGVQVSREDAASAAATLRELLSRTDLSALSDEDRARVHEDAAAISDEMASPEPSPDKVVGRLERLTSILSAGGALAGAGVDVVALGVDGDGETRATTRVEWRRVAAVAPPPTLRKLASRWPSGAEDRRSAPYRRALDAALRDGPWDVAVIDSLPIFQCAHLSQFRDEVARDG